MTVYAFWSNQSCTGKTSLAFQAMCFYARDNPTRRILAIDACPQADLSELLLGGAANGGRRTLLMQQGEVPRRTLGGYFGNRMATSPRPGSITPGHYISTPHDINPAIPPNIDLIAGDPLIELQNNTITTLASAPTSDDAWLRVVDWLRDLIEATGDLYDLVGIDTNPSFSLYAQIALASADRIVLPVAADQASRQSIHNALSLTHGLRLPCELYSAHAFSTRLPKNGRALPKVHVVVRNRLAQYVGESSTYGVARREIVEDFDRLLQESPEVFTFDSGIDAILDVEDLQSAATVAFARGLPLYRQREGRFEVMGRRVRVSAEYVERGTTALRDLAARL